MKKLSVKDVVYLAIIILLIAAVVTLSVLLGYSLKREKAKQSTLYYDLKCTSFQLENAHLSKGQIVFIGDSITDYYPLDNYYQDLPLATYNRGIAGDVTSGVLGRLQNSLFDLAPTKVVLLIGINDIDVGVSDETILANYKEILSRIKAALPATQVHCMSILPQHEAVERFLPMKAADNNKRIVALDEKISALAETYGYTYVDLYSSLVDENNILRKELSDDGLHLNDAGYAIWTSILKPYLQ